MLLTNWIRVFLGDNGTITDQSLLLNNNSGFSHSFVAAEDYLYIAQNRPFNNMFFEIDSANATPTIASVELWDGQAWQNALDELDGTASGGASMAQDGVLQFSPDRDEFWECVEDTRDEPSAFGLESDVALYDSYFLRISFSADFTLSLKRVGYLFAQDEQLSAIDPEINNYLDSWQSGKTDWIEQIRIASEHVITDMQGRGLVVHPGNILRLSDVSLATAYRTLALIYNKFGEGFEFQKNEAMKSYNMFMSKKRWILDTNNNAEVDRGEQSGTPAGIGVR